LMLVGLSFLEAQNIWLIFFNKRQKQSLIVDCSDAIHIPRKYFHEKKPWRRGWESNPPDDLRRQSLANFCTSRYAPSPLAAYYLKKIPPSICFLVNFMVKIPRRSRIAAITTVLKTVTSQGVRGFESHLLRREELQV